MPDGLSERTAPFPDSLAPEITSSACSPGFHAAALRWKSLVKGLAKLLTTGVLAYLTYLSAMYLAHSGKSPASVLELTAVGVRKEMVPLENAQPEPIAALPRSSLPAPLPAWKPGPFDSSPAVAAKPEAAAARPAAALKSDNVAARPEFGRSQVEARAPKPLPAQVPATVVAVAPPGSARGGLTQEQLYKVVCQACHDLDGKGGMVRKLMPEIPDFTDSRWQESRKDPDLIRSIKEGKGRLMLPMKDRLSQARIEPEEMVAFLRGFDPSRVTTAPPAGSPPRPKKR